MSRSSERENEENPIPVPEWIVAGLGLTLVCLALFFLLYKAFFLDDGDPELKFKVESIVPQDGGALILAEVSNTGGTTVSALQIIGFAGDEEHEVEIDFLPARSSRKFGMFFSKVPESDDVKFSPGGYQEP